jgi:uncharacterized protein
MRIVIDTNDYISAMIGKKHRDKLTQVLSRTDIEIFADKLLIDEIRGVANREKFRKYISIEAADLFIETLYARLTFIVPTTTVFDSPDPDDNFLLSLAIDSNADYLVSGDKNGLIALSPYRGIKILRLFEFLEIL